MVRMQIVGWANLAELLIQTCVLGISGNNSNNSFVDGFFSPNATSASGARLTVESIFFNQVPILDANFFNFETAGGYSLRLKKEENSAIDNILQNSSNQDDSEQTEETPIDKENVV